MPPQTFTDAPLTDAQQAQFTDAPLAPPAEPTTYAGDVARYAGGAAKGFARGLIDVINPLTYFQMGQGVVEGLKDLPAYVHGFSKEDLTAHLPAYLMETLKSTLEDPEQLGRVLGNVVTGAVTGAAIKGAPMTEGGPTVGDVVAAGRDAVAEHLPIHPAMAAIAKKLGLDAQLLAKETGLSVEDVQFAQRYGMDPDRIDMATAKMQLQTAKKATRIATQLRQWAEDAAEASTGRTATAQPLILTPEQLQLHEQQMANAGLLAREQGMRSAAYGKAAWKPPQAAPQPAATLPVETPAAASTPAPLDRPVPAPPVVPPSAAAAVARLKMTPDEAQAYVTLRGQGQSGAQAEAAILKARALAKKLGTPPDEAMRAAVATRNATGRWD